MELSQNPYFLDADAAQWVESTRDAMSVEQKVGQIMCPYLRTSDVPSWVAWLKEKGIEPGGVMLLMNSREQSRSDVAALQAASTVALLVAANLESGAVNFLRDAEAFANPMQIAATGDPVHARRLAIHCARAANDVGVNWSFAPVCDVALNPDNPITNTRTFGDDAETVAQMTEAYVAEMEARRIATSTKHFPGDGVDGRDQHLVTTNNDLDVDEWEREFGSVYRRAIAAGTRTIMVGHIRHPAFTRAFVPDVKPSQILPATLSRELLTAVLRERLGFNGMAVSDNTAMAGYTTAMPREQALVCSINAGIDMLLGNVDLEEDFGILVSAACRGDIDRARLDEAVTRVLAVKASIGLHLPAAGAAELPDIDEEARWRDELAAASVTLVKDTQALLPLDPSRHKRALVYVLGDEPTFYDPSGAFAPHFADELRSRGLEVEIRSIPGNSTTIAEAAKMHEAFDVCLYFANVRHVGNTQTLRLSWSPWQGWDAPRHVAKLPTALVSIADPYHLQDVPMIKTAVNGYTPSISTVDAIARVLFGEATAAGRSPVDPFVGLWDAQL